LSVLLVKKKKGMKKEGELTGSKFMVRRQKSVIQRTLLFNFLFEGGETAPARPEREEKRKDLFINTKGVSVVHSGF